LHLLAATGFRLRDFLHWRHMLVVMFLYLTSSLALFGRTAGMSFSLELIDADLDEYPSFIRPQ
jgi:hypothetical protein